MTTFALPNIDATSMNSNEQGAMLVNQATAVVFEAYAQHLTAMAQLANTDSTLASGSVHATFVKSFMIAPNEIKGLLRDIQDELKAF